MDKVIELAKEYLEGLEHFDNNFFDKFEEKLDIKKGIFSGYTKINNMKYDDSINPLFKKRSFDTFISGKKCTFNPIICTNTTKIIRYNLKNIKLTEIGGGSFATVYTIGNDNRYVLKMIRIIKPSNHGVNNDYKKLLKNLFFNYILQLYLFKINKKNITCNIYEFGKVEYNYKTTSSGTESYDHLYCIMENGGYSLEKYIINNKINNIQTIYKIFRICASHVNTIHKLGYIHLDIKLDNFLIKNNNINTIKIIDFDTVLKKNTEINYEIGTLQYIHPDIFNCDEKNKLKVTEKHDIFSLGCLYLYILYNRKIDIKEIIAMPFNVLNKKFSRHDYMNKRNDYKSSYKNELEKLIFNKTP